MQLHALEKKFLESSQHFRERKHADSLDLVESISDALPGSPAIQYLRARNLAAMNRVDEALEMCNTALHDLRLSREQYHALAAFMDDRSPPATILVAGGDGFKFGVG